jgi:hypothetical protein
MPKHFLSVAAIFKNEADILGEWIEHYLAEGVEHFYLIENNSEDDWERVLAPYRERGLVTLFTEKGEQAQFRAYDEFIRPIRDSEWMIVVDLDEFVYATPGNTITGFLSKLPPNVGSVQLPWILFGSSGYDRQPDGVVKNFLWRKFYLGSWELHKAIVRPSRVTKMMIHDHEFIPDTIHSSGSGLRMPLLGGSGLAEGRIASDVVRLNHYQIQSRDRYMRLKTGRGDAVFSENHRSIDTYRENAAMMGSTKDETLALKRRME